MHHLPLRSLLAVPLAVLLLCTAPVAQRRTVDATLPSDSGGPPNQSDASMDVPTPLGGDTGFTVDFEEFVNGAALDGRASRNAFFLTASGDNAGPAIFDSDPNGPNAGGADPDLLVDSGNILILQSNAFPDVGDDGSFDIPNDALFGGTLVLSFFTPAAPRSITLIDLCPDGGDATLTLVDGAGATRTFSIPAGYTNDVAAQGAPGAVPLDLRTLAPQPGVHSIATAAEDPGFDEADVVRIEFFLEGSGALDDLELTNPRCSYPEPSSILGAEDELVVADFNEDGNPDVVVLERISNGSNVVVLLNRGDGVFLEPLRVLTIETAKDVAVGDMDLDGHLDVVVTSSGFVNIVGVHLNAGDGSLEPPIELPVTDTSEGLALGDLDGDGLLEIVTSPGGSGGFVVHVFKNLGNGQFGPPDIYQPGTTANGSSVPLLSDFDGNGDLDLLVPWDEDDTFYWSNDGSGGFEPDVRFNTGAADRLEDALLADLDGDGDDDVYLLPRNSDVSWLRNLGNGSFAAQPRVLVGGLAEWFALYDHNLDGRDDLIIARNGLVVVSNPDGSLNPPVPSDFALDFVPGFFSIDMNRDGFDDAVFATERRVTVTRAVSPGVFEQREPLNQNGQLCWVELEDVDGDGTPDLLIGNDTDDEVVVRRGRGGTSFGNPTFSPIARGDGDHVLADLDADGDLDLGVEDSSNDLIFLYSNDGTGSFQEESTIVVPNEVSDFAIGDLDGDGLADVAAISSLGTNDTLIVYTNQGGFAFMETHSTSAISIDKIVAADVDEDGHVDLLATGFVPGYVTAFYNNAGNGTFTKVQRALGQCDAFGRPTVADVNGDGNLDVGVAIGGFFDSSNCDEAIYVYLNASAGQLSNPAVTETRDIQRGGQTIELVDIDLDGHLDMVREWTFGNVVSFHPGHGDGTFGFEMAHAATNRPTDYVLRDLNGDGRPDVIVIGTNDVDLLLSSCY